MELRKVEIKHFCKGSFLDDTVENVRHVKVLPWLSIVQVTQGSYDIQLGIQPGQNTVEGGFFIAPSGVQQTLIHHVNPITGLMQARWLFLDVVINDTHRLDALYDFPTVVPEVFKKALHDIFDLLFSNTSIFEIYSSCYQILGVLLKTATAKTTFRHESMHLALDYIEKNYAHNIRIEALAKYSHMSESNFYAVFKKHFGIPPMVYINRIRISLAAEQLRETDDPISKIADMVGIHDSLYFNKMFHKMYQTSPKKYRDSYRKGLNSY